MLKVRYSNQFKKDYWLLIYIIEDDKITLTLSRTGSHSDLF